MGELLSVEVVCRPCWWIVGRDEGKHSDTAMKRFLAKKVPFTKSFLEETCQVSVSYCATCEVSVNYSRDSR